MKSEATVPALWLEVSNVRLQYTGGADGVVEVQVRGDQEEYWLQTKEHSGCFKSLLEAFKEKKPVHARLGVEADKKELCVTGVAIYSAPPAKS